MSASPTLYGYDPARVVALRHRTIEAIDELATLRCDDPLAADALRVVRLLRHNLEDSWLPLIDAICSSRALVAWRTALRAALVDAPDGPIPVALPECLRTWIATTSLGHLADHVLAERLGRAASEVVDRVRRGGDLHDALAELTEVAREARQRAEHDPGGPVGAVLLGALGPHGVDALLGALAALHGLVRSAHPSDVSAAEAVVSDLATAVATIAATSDAVAGTLGEAITRSDDLGRAVVAHLERFDGATVLALTRHLMAAFGRIDVGDARWAGAVRAVDDVAVLQPLLARLAAEPVLALELLTDRGVLRTLVLDELLDPMAVEDVVAAGLAAPGVAAVHFVPALEVLAELVTVTSRHDLSIAARRGIARSFGVFLPHLAPHLDRRLPVDVTVRGEHGTTVVALGEYGALTRLVGQVVDDDAAQLLLGLVVGAFREEQLGSAATVVRDPARAVDPVAAREVVAAALADVTRVVTLVERGVDDRNRLLAFLHGSHRNSLTTVHGLLVNLVSWFAPGAPMSGRIATASSRLVTSALSSSSPPRVPETGIRSELASHFLVSAIALPVADERVRTALGLDRVDGAVWAEVVDIVEAIEASDDPDELRRLRSRVRAAASADPMLDAYLEMLSVTSGDAALG